MPIVFISTILSVKRLKPWILIMIMGAAQGWDKSWKIWCDKQNRKEQPHKVGGEEVRRLDDEKKSWSQRERIGACNFVRHLKTILRWGSRDAGIGFVSLHVSGNTGGVPAAPGRDDILCQGWAAGSSLKLFSGTYIHQLNPQYQHQWQNLKADLRSVHLPARDLYVLASTSTARFSYLR